MELIFGELERVLKHYELDLDAAYFHGLLSGLICAGIEDEDIDDWLPALFANRFMAQDLYQQLSDNVLEVFHSVRAELNEDGFGYQILLPDDEIVLHRRVQLMGSWCRGYLTALIDYAETAIEYLPENCVEFIDDVASMVEIELDDEAVGDTLEESFMLLEQHLRVGVQLMYEHMNPLQPS